MEGKRILIELIKNNNQNTLNNNLEGRYPDYQMEFYKMCTKEYTQKKMSSIKEDFEWLIKKFRDVLKSKEIWVEKIILYGSYARGNTNEYSDIDIAVISEDFEKGKIGAGIKLFRISASIDPRLEPVAFSSKSYNEDTWLPLIYEIRTKGIELFTR